MVNTLSILGGGFIGKNFTWYTEQPFVDGGDAGITEQAWVSWNGFWRHQLAAGRQGARMVSVHARARVDAQRLSAGHPRQRPERFRAERSALGLNVQRHVERVHVQPVYTTGTDPIQHAFDFNKEDANRIRGFQSVVRRHDQAVDGRHRRHSRHARRCSMRTTVSSTPICSRAKVCTTAGRRRKWHIQTMYYHGWDDQPDWARRAHRSTARCSKCSASLCARITYSRVTTRQQRRTEPSVRLGLCAQLRAES